MQEIPRQLMAWIRRLLPQQKNTGSGAVQIGKAGGDVTVVNITQHIAPPYILASGLSPAANTTPTKRQANHAQREVLLLMKQLNEREGLVLDFMQREFATRRVIELNDAQLFRVRRYVEVSLQRGQ